MKDKARPYALLIGSPTVTVAGMWLHVRLVAACGECAKNHRGLILTVSALALLGMVFAVSLVWYVFVERRAQP
jgi:hypothetical protein